MFEYKRYLNNNVKKELFDALALNLYPKCSGGFTPTTDVDTPVTASAGRFRTHAPVQQPFDLAHCHQYTSQPHRTTLMGHSLIYSQINAFNIHLPTVILDPITCLAKGSFESSDLITTTGFIAYFFIG